MKIDGVGSVTIVAHVADVPLVVKYLPELPDCEGNASTVAQDAAEPLEVRYLPLAPDWLGTTYTLDVLRSRVALPDVAPPNNPVPATTAVISPEDVNTCHEDVPPFQTYML